MKNGIIRFASFVSLAVFLSSGVGIAEEGEPSSRPRKAIEEEIAALQQRIQHREERVAELTSDMLSYDERAERRTGKVLSSIETITDSPESGTKIARTKKEAIEALKNCVEHYRSRRAALKRETMQRSPRISREELFDDIGRFDERIEERLDRIISIVNSMQLHRDYEKWTGTDGFYRYRNSRYYHNRSETVYTERERQKVLEELKSEIRSLQLRSREIRTRLEAETTPQYEVMLLDELDENSAKIERRQKQIIEVTIPGTPQTQPVGRGQANAVDSVVDDVANDLEEDCRAIWRAYLQINRERQILVQLRDQLVASLAELELLDARMREPGN